MRYARLLTREVRSRSGQNLRSRGSTSLARHSHHVTRDGFAPNTRCLLEARSMSGVRRSPRRPRTRGAEEPVPSNSADTSFSAQIEIIGDPRKRRPDQEDEPRGARKGTSPHSRSAPRRKCRRPRIYARNGCTCEPRAAARCGREQRHAHGRCGAIRAWRSAQHLGASLGLGPCARCQHTLASSRVGCAEKQHEHQRAASHVEFARRHAGVSPYQRA